MATSGSYNFTNTRDFIVTEAFRKIGGLGDGQSLDAVRMAIGVGVFNPMVKAFANQGLHIWTRDQVSIPFSAWTPSIPVISVGPTGSTYVTNYKPLKLIEAYRRDALTGQDIPLTPLTRNEWEAQNNKFTLATPTMVFYEPQAYDGKLYLWQCPDSYWQANGIFVGVFQRQIQDLDNSNDEPDFPAEWHEALIYQLAYRLAPNYGLAPGDRTALKQDADQFLRQALDFDMEEGSIYLRPDKR